jgi:hypothetical protein
MVVEMLVVSIAVDVVSSTLKSCDAFHRSDSNFHEQAVGESFRSRFLRVTGVNDRKKTLIVTFASPCKKIIKNFSVCGGLRMYEVQSAQVFRRTKVHS